MCSGKIRTSYYPSSINSRVLIILYQELHLTLLFLIFLLSSTMNSFAIALFKTPQEFVAAYLGKSQYSHSFVLFLEKAIRRTKSPPLAVTYTYHFLQDKSEEELSLDIIRFVSQLSDVSPGVSMSGSLHGILTESAFLTELRHNLTHKTLIKGNILALGRKLILQELEEKYWKITFQKFKSTYRLDAFLVQQCYFDIYGAQLPENILEPNQSKNIEFFKTCSNYEYKEHIVTILQDFKQCKINSAQLMPFCSQVPSFKQTLFVAIILQMYLTLQTEIEHFTHFVLKLVNKLNQDVLSSDLVFRQLLKCHFLKYLNHANKLLQNLPQTSREAVQSYWKEKQAAIGPLYKSE